MASRTYDLIVLIDADAPSETRAKLVTDAEALLNQHGAVQQQKDWGLRQTPYQIDHHEEATYHVFQFEAEPEAVATLDRALKLTEGILRFRMFQAEPGVIPETPPAIKRDERAYERPPKNVAAAENIVEVPDAPAAVDGGDTAAMEAVEAPAAESVAAEAVPAEPEVTPEAEPVAPEAPAEAAVADDAV
ncbi:MAG: 30S ribosomal protein S6 [Thermoleophilaceae bacterium]|nr:30S ribosomal protein S6 [Thermoleophilaceae bacterium]